MLFTWLPHRHHLGGWGEFLLLAVYTTYYMHIMNLTFTASPCLSVDTRRVLFGGVSERQHDMGLVVGCKSVSLCTLNIIGGLRDLCKQWRGTHKRCYIK